MALVSTISPMELNRRISIFFGKCIGDKDNQKKNALVKSNSWDMFGKGSKKLLPENSTKTDSSYSFTNYNKFIRCSCLLFFLKGLFLSGVINLKKMN